MPQVRLSSLTDHTFSDPVPEEHVCFHAVPNIFVILLLFFSKTQIQYYINKSKHDIFMIDKIKPSVGALIYAISSFLHLWIKARDKG